MDLQNPCQQCSLTWVDRLLEQNRLHLMIPGIGIGMVLLRLISLVTCTTTDVVVHLTKQCPSQKEEDRQGMDALLLNNYTIEDPNLDEDPLPNNMMDEGRRQGVTRSRYRMVIMIHVDRRQED